jgi:beta-lactamase class A
MRAHVRPPHRPLPRFDPWLAAFLVALGVFSVSLLVGTVIVLQSLRATAVTPDLELVAPSAHASAAANATTRKGASTVPAAVTTPARANAAALQTPVPTLTGDPQLYGAIVAALGPDLEHYGVVVKRLTDGRGATVNADKQFYAASLFKLAVLEEAERRQSAGTLNFDDEITLTDEDVSEDLGTLSEVPMDSSGSLSIRDALRAMVTVSDNATAVALLHLLGGPEIDETLRSLGLTTMSVNTTDLPTTASDMALLMEAVVTGRGLTAEGQADARTLLLGQEVRSGVPQGVPGGVKVGNKTGTWDNATHDVAFVEAPGGTYVIAVLTDGSGGWAPIARVSAAVYSLLAQP